MKTFRPHKSSFCDISANVVSILCYLCITLFWTFGLIPVLALFFSEKRSRLVKFHSMQAVLLWAAGYVAGGGITFEAFAALLTGESSYMNNPMGWAAPLEILLFRLAMNGLVVFLAVVGVVYAYRWQIWRIPVLGHIAQAVAKRCSLQESGAPQVETAILQEFAPSVHDIESPAADYANTLKMNIIRRFDTDEFEPVPGGDAELAEPESLDAPDADPQTADGEGQMLLTAVQPDDPNGQLPAEMRDQPLSKSLDDIGCYVGQKRAGIQRGNGKRRRIKQNAKAGPENTRRSYRLKTTNNSVIESNSAGAAPAVAPVAHHVPELQVESGAAPDPNRQLPLEMRDPPMPADML